MSKLTHEDFKKKALKDAGVKLAYDKLEEEFTLIAELIKARKIAGKSQAEVANIMHTSPSVISRLEGGSQTVKHSPSVDTLRRYAEAVGCKLKITLESTLQANSS
ncbi:MAG: helix-turn-helix transcriptional regulator [Rickettsiaceae bacterium]|nr:helix-turn-helix transcriptional regulator [Rickettsiaceae bacterium]